MDPNQEKQQIEKAREDGSAFGPLFDEYYPRILKFVLKRTGHLQSSQDITAEVFFKAYKNLWAFRWRNISFGAWLYKIAMNETNNYFKRGKRAPVPVGFLEELERLSVTFDSPESDLVKMQEDLNLRQDLVRLYEAVQKLPLKYQEVITLRYFEEKSLQETSEILGKRLGTVKSLVSRGLDLLEKLMQPNLGSAVVQSEKAIINSPRHEQARH